MLPRQVVFTGPLPSSLSVLSISKFSLRLHNFHIRRSHLSVKLLVSPTDLYRQSAVLLRTCPVFVSLVSGLRLNVLESWRLAHPSSLCGHRACHGFAQHTIYGVSQKTTPKLPFVRFWVLTPGLSILGQIGAGHEPGLLAIAIASGAGALASSKCRFSHRSAGLRLALVGPSTAGSRRDAMQDHVTRGALSAFRRLMVWSTSRWGTTRTIVCESRGLATLHVSLSPALFAATVSAMHMSCHEMRKQRPPPPPPHACARSQLCRDAIQNLVEFQLQPWPCACYEQSVLSSRATGPKP